MNIKEIWDSPMYSCMTWGVCKFARSDKYCHIVGDNMDEILKCQGNPSRNLMNKKQPRAKKQTESLFDKSKYRRVK